MISLSDSKLCPRWVTRSREQNHRKSLLRQLLKHKFHYFLNFISMLACNQLQLEDIYILLLRLVTTLFVQHTYIAWKLTESDLFLLCRWRHLHCQIVQKNVIQMVWIHLFPNRQPLQRLRVTGTVLLLDYFISR